MSFIIKIELNDSKKTFRQRSPFLGKVASYLGLVNEESLIRKELGVIVKSKLEEYNIKGKCSVLLEDGV